MTEQITLLGRLGQEPDLKHTQSQKAVCTFSIAVATNSDKTEWHNIVVFGDEATFCKATLKKGQEVFVHGRIKNNSWTDRNNITHEKKELIANQIGLTYFNKNNTYTNG